MRISMGLLAAMMLLGSCGTTFAAEPGSVPSAMLAQMGLDGMTEVSDAQGDLVRGKGFVLVGGFVSGGTSYLKFGAGPYVSRSGVAFGSGGITGGSARAK